MRRVVTRLAIPALVHAPLTLASALAALAVSAFAGCGGGDADTAGVEGAVTPAGPGLNDASTNTDASGAGSAIDGATRRDASFIEDELADATYPNDVHFTWDSGGSDALLTSDASCAETSAAATLRPLDLFVVLDRSGSMSERNSTDTSAVWGTNDCNVSAAGPSNTSKWCLTVNALGAFFDLAGQGDRRAALNFFPTNLELGTGISVVDPTGVECTGSAVSTPAVSLVAIPANAAQLVSALNTATPNGAYTTTEGAIRGMNTFTSAAVNRSAARTLAQVLITDGRPTACTLRDNAGLAAIIDTQRTVNGVNTYVVGMLGADYAGLETLALSGGAPAHTNLCASGSSSCHYYDVGLGASAGFSQALRDIQLAAVGCAYNLPAPPRGLLDPDRVRVTYDSGGPASDLTRVQSASNCGSSPSSWHYDNNTSPTSVRLCPAACSVVRANAAAKVNVLFGCLRG